ncbi:LacI family DNA-binding transcriptional regulator [Anaerotalea alkaliphila]|uniref:Substrate-binding domain-containing protein n=1 Tax=Anaerotalea alkaliphila TaxID=2662126 RepID=A0A7X5HTL3_9FIRM|nr:LacI family DNA-binding transcriptional regulator [Anaerotalea alkaliphila]NDL66440.1 substrate-binding domain-containing protein [Anaerotalea alkaliphila]
MKVTIKAIAEMAGVHRSTVDKVLHKRVGVSDDVREKIQSIIDELGYEPNPIGKALKRQEEKLVIAAVLLKVDALEQIKEGMEKAIRTYKGLNMEIRYHVIQYPDVDAQVKVIQDLVREGVEGILLLPIHDARVKEAIDEAVGAGVPVITTNSDIEGSKRMCFVGQDSEKAGRVAGRLMGEFLGSKGQVAVITSALHSETSVAVAGREKGFQELLRQTYPDIDIRERVESMEDPDLVYQDTVKILDRNPELKGIYITCGGVSGLGKALKDKGMAGRIKVVCFERYPEILALMKEGVVNCTIDSELEEQGYRTCRILADHLLYDREPEKELLFTKSSILVKESIEE